MAQRVIIFLQSSSTVSAGFQATVFDESKFGDRTDVQQAVLEALDTAEAYAQMERMQPGYREQRERDLLFMRTAPPSIARRLYHHYHQLCDWEACQMIADHIREREPRETPYV